MAQDFTALNFGWWSYHHSMMPDMYEYGNALAFAWDCPTTVMINDLSVIDSHPRTKDNLEVMRRWEYARANGVITKEIAAESLSRLEVDHLGLDSIDRRILTMMIKNYNGGPVGLETLAAATGEEAVTIEDVYEPYLMQIGFLTRTPRGRCATALAYEHLGIAMPAQPCGECEQMRIGE